MRLGSHRSVQAVAVARWRALLVAVVLAIVAMVAGEGTAYAHTGFESSTPAEGATVSEPVDVVTIVFTGEATPVGDEFIALTPEGVLQPASSIETTDDMVFTVRFDPPLTGGQVGIRWNVQAADAHPIEGAFAFTVTAPAPTTAPPTTAPPETVAPTTVAPGTSLPATTVTPAPDAVDDVGPPGEDAPSEAVLSLDEFLAVDDSRPGETTATVGRLVGFLGVALGIGALAFLATALRGRRDEVDMVRSGIRVLGVVIAIGAAIEYVGVGRIANESLATGWSSAPGFAAALRIVGGIGLAVGLAGLPPRTSATRPAASRSLSSAVAAPREARSSEGERIVRWAPDARSWPAFTGIALVIVSFWFDGHTVSKGFRPLHALVNSVHVVAGAIWVGGVVTMAAVLWSRHRAGRPTRGAELVVRFSKIASLALAAVVVAGLFMAFFVLDSFGELTGTPWGQILLLKTVAVGLAAAGGAYNHFRLLPALEDDPESPDVLAELRSTVTAEAIMLVFVVAVTAWLVAAATAAS
ncbi:copper resistance CopC/CopD family protein [Ilumatobacter coccineus]|uniref:Putative copper resistance protein n=1 Tax=Ilumatobacter coccineus (strain NBRC 103263 / KCTC 29153 / YM16-304) TaxID=1313172 RepID=A0A6C7EAZ7_ILUCY|nr:CopD family protein [Ilumatobacter coccineus]BAN03493.1 putative copper resistance protein [Ilumatobacter coccineus YM16-304]